MAYLEFGGDWDGQFVNYFNFNFLKCPEGEFNIHGDPCGSVKDEQDMISNYIYASFFFPIILVDPSNYTSPLIKDIKNVYYQLDNNIVKNGIIKMGEIVISSDNGWIIESRINEGLISYESLVNDYSLLSTYIEDEYFRNLYGSISIYMNKRYVKYIRTYEKIQTLAANVGGVLKIFTFIFALLNKTYSKFLLEYELINYIKSYNFGDSSVHNIQLDISAVSKVEPPIKRINESAGTLSINKSPINKFTKFSSLKFKSKNNETKTNQSNTKNITTKTGMTESKGFDYLLKLNNVIALNKLSRSAVKNISFQTYLLIYSLCCKFKSRVYVDDYRKKLINFLDIRNIISNIIKVERFNDVILTKEEQTRLFNKTIDYIEK